MDNLGEAALSVLETPLAEEKAAKSIICATLWREGSLARDCTVRPPDRPARPDKPELLAPSKMPKRGKAQTRENRAALLHAIAHIELNAIDLAWDMVARFGENMPRAFLNDWVSIAADEARHFNLLSGLLVGLEMRYGDLPAHDGLWQAAYETRKDLLARLAVVSLVLEARGLDVTPDMIERLKKSGDQMAVSVLKTILEEEISHVRAGVRWFRYACKQQKKDPTATYQALVKKHFRGILKPPFNEKARSLAGLEKEFYLPLAGKG